MPLTSRTNQQRSSPVDWCSSYQAKFILTEECVVASDFLGGLARTTREALIASGVRRQFPASTMIYFPGNTAWTGVVTRGVVRSYSHDRAGRLLTHRNVGPGSLIGLGALIGIADTLGAQAIGDVSVVRLNLPSTSGLLRGDPAFSLAVARELFEQLGSTEGHLALRLRGSQRQRLALELLDRAVEPNASGGAFVRTTHEDLAVSLGSSREVITRHLLALSDCGLVVQRHRGFLELPDTSRLLSVAQDMEADRGTIPDRMASRA